MKRNHLLPGLMAFMLALAACVRKTPAPATTPPTAVPTVTPTETVVPTPTPDPALIARDYPRVDGSSSTLPLQMILACKLLGVPYVWVGGPTDPEFALFFTEVRQVIPDPEYEVAPDVLERLYAIQHFGTHGSYLNLIGGTADFILVARPPSQDELDEANALGVTLDARPVALDAFVFLVNAQNPVESLTLGEVRDIYTGEITHWGEVEGSGLSGRGEPIQAYQRDRNSGSQELMETLVMKGTPMFEAPYMILETMMGPINAISEDPFGIGYSVYYYATFIFPAERVKLAAIDGVLPTSENIADRSYPLTTEVYAVVRDDMPADSSAVLLRDWLLTDDSQAVVEESGYVPIQ